LPTGVALISMVADWNATLSVGILADPLFLMTALMTEFFESEIVPTGLAFEDESGFSPG